MNKHVIRGGGPVHAWDCPPCVEEAERRDLWARENNPHRKNTKAAAEWYRNNRGGPHIDPRYETYWSM